MSHPSPLDELVRSAESASLAGRLEEAAKAWDRVLAVVPEHPRALFFFGQMLLKRGDAREARWLFQRAAAAAPREPMIAVNLANACRALEDETGEMETLDRALTIDPYCYPALLMKAAACERRGELRQAARLFGDALKIVPPDAQLPTELRERVRHAREIVCENSLALEAHLRQSLSGLRSRFAAACLDRLDECEAIMAGTKKVYMQEPTLLHFPGLPAVCFYEREQFPWLAGLEAKTAAIREELISLLRAREGDFKPYVDHPPGVPLNQWAELNNSKAWSALFLWRDGNRIEDICASCRETATVLNSLPLAAIPGYAPSAFFSALEPHTHIPPHTGVTNARLIVHLPLIVPGPARFRVGNYVRDWREGEAWVFDDTIEHEAWNDADSLRALLIFDVWNPLLSRAEREMVSELLLARREYYGGGTASTHA
jgi:ornithine lipid ester-linked acyl 2-hydroxylase